MYRGNSLRSRKLVYVNFSAAHAQNATEVCNAGCVQKRVDALDQKINSLEQTIDALAIEMKQIHKNWKKGNPPHRFEPTWWLPHLYWPGWRFGRLRSCTAADANCSKYERQIFLHNRTLPIKLA
jgi:hypothetical protein